MSVHYFDASVMVKYYLTEPGSTWVRALVEAIATGGLPQHDLFTTELSWVEVPSAFAAVHRAGRISRLHLGQTYELFMGTVVRRYQMLPVRESLLMQAAHLTQSHILKAYDAVHLATALQVQVRLRRLARGMTFVSGDAQLLRAAAAEGLAIEDPFRHRTSDE